MKGFLLKNKGITLVSLVITIIIMLILAGVSLSMVTGETSVINQAKKTAFMQEIAGYKEELAISFLGKAAKEQKKIDKSVMQVSGKYMKDYIPSMKEEDFDDYMIYKGELYYIGDDEFELSVCEEQGYITSVDGATGGDMASAIEGKMFQDLIHSMAGETLKQYNADKDAEEEIGLKLARKVGTSGFGNGVSDPWTIITETVNGENVATYADGWYYVTAGTDVPSIGTLRNSYIINYSTNKAVKFDSSKHIILSNKGNLAVVDGLIFNADPTNMDGSTTSWGGATLFGFTGTEKDEAGNVISGWTPTSLNFDGVNDYLQFKPNSRFQTDGITIEMYGYLNNETGHSTMTFYKGLPTGASESFKQTVSNRKSDIAGCKQPNDNLRIDGVYTIQSSKYGGGYVPSGSAAQCPNWRCDFHIVLDNKPHKGDICITYVLDNVGNYKVYKDGVLIKEDKWSDEYAQYYNKNLNTDYPIQMGVWYQGNERHYSKQKIYSLRVYDKTLTAEEVMLNYRASSAYHNILENNGEADNNNTGGGDINDVIKVDN